MEILTNIFNTAIIGTIKYRIDNRATILKRKLYLKKIIRCLHIFILKNPLYIFFLHIKDQNHEIKLFADNVKVRVRLLSKETTKIDKNESS